ncbi:MAG: response regulator transcription factor [Pseudomonadota bacterium]
MQILLVNDDIRVAEFLIRGLRAEARYVVRAPGAGDGIEALASGAFDLVLLGDTVGGVAGHAFCRQLRLRGYTTPILMLSTPEDPDAAVELLRAGADDYLPQPLDFNVLLARIDALVRRACRLDAANGLAAKVLQVGPIVLNAESLMTFVDEQPIEMSAREREMLALFLSKPGRVFSRERILNAVWGLSEDPLTNVVDVYVSKLRRKLGPHAGLLKTVRGAGYRLDPA